MADGDAASEVGPDLAEAIPDGIVDRLQGGEPIAEPSDAAHASAEKWSTHTNAQTQRSRSV